MKNDIVVDEQSCGTDLEDSEAGMATAEYAIGTVAATSLSGILIWIFQQDWVREGFVAIIKAIFDF